MTRHLFLSCLLCVSSTLAVMSAHAAEPPTIPVEDATKTEAKQYFEEGILAFRASQYKDAIDAFLEANRRYPSAAISFNIAKAYEKLQDAAGALKFFRDYLRRQPEAPDRAQILIRMGELEDLLRSNGVQQVSVLSTPEGASLVLDGQPVGVTPWSGEIRPGIHKVVLKVKGYTDFEDRVDLPAHRSLEVDYTLTKRLAPAIAKAKPNAAPNPPLPRTLQPQPESHANPWIWLTLGTSGAALGGALWFEVASAGAEKDARNASTQRSAQSHINVMQSSQSTARILAGVGGALAVGGGIWLWTDLTGKHDARNVALSCGGLQCAIEGEF